MVISCSSTSNSAIKIGNIETEQNLPSPKHNLTTAQLSKLLIGELSLQRGDYKTSTTQLIEAAKSTQDLNTAIRATYSAQLSQTPDLLIQASFLWSQLAPQDPLPWQYIAQAQSLNQQFEKTIDALEKELKRGGGEGLVRVANLSTDATQKGLQHQFQLWLGTYPSHKKIYYALAILAKKLDQTDQAIAHIETSLSFDERYLEAQFFYGDLLIQSNDLDGADRYLSQYTRPLEQAPSVLINQHAQTFTLMRRPVLAYEYFKELTRRQPNHFYFQYSAGLLAYENNDYSATISYLKKAIELDPTKHSAFYYMALSALREELPNQAIGFLSQINQGPDRVNALNLLVELEAPNTLSRASYFLQLRDQNQDLSPHIFALEISYLQQAQDFEATTQTYQKALHKHPNNISLLYAYALFADSLHQFDITEQMLQRIIDIEPNHVNALNALGYSYAERNIKLKEAQVLILKALALDPKNPAIMDSLGWVKYRLGHLRQSLNLLSQAYDIMPIAEMAAHLGVVKWALGDTQGAFNTWNLALEKEPDNALIKQAILDAQNEFQKD